MATIEERTVKVIFSPQIFAALKEMAEQGGYSKAEALNDCILIGSTAAKIISEGGIVVARKKGETKCGEFYMKGPLDAAL